MAEENQKLSKHNQGVAIVNRLDRLWQDANNHSRKGLYKMWNEDLDVLWRELARDIKNEDYEDKERLTKEGKREVLKGFKTKFQDLDNELIKLGTFNDDAEESFTKPKKEEIEKRNKQYRALSDKELFLRRVENHVGKGTKFDDDDDDED